MKQDEHNTQVACVNWFRYQYPNIAKVLFAVPNGGRRDRVTGAKLKAEGAMAGVADMVLLYPTALYHALCIEFKTKTGRQSDSQKQFAEAVKQFGNAYVIVRSFDEFVSIVEQYLHGTSLMKGGLDGKR